MIDDRQLSFSLPSVSRKKVTAVFDGGRLSTDSGVMLLALVERRRNVAATLTALIADRRDPSPPPFAEPMLLRIASAYEAATGHRIPPPEFGPVGE